MLITGNPAFRYFFHPLFSDATSVQVVRALQLRLPLADCLGVAAEETGNVLNPTVAQLRSLNRRIAPPILLSQGIEQSLHHALDLRPVGVHAILLMLHSVSPAG